MKNGEIMVNMGNATGIADIEADEAVFSSENEYSDEQCEIRIKFVKPGEIKVDQISNGSACGFGHNVSASGTFTKISNRKPIFDEDF